MFPTPKIDRNDPEYQIRALINSMLKAEEALNSGYRAFRVDDEETKDAVIEVFESLRHVRKTMLAKYDSYCPDDWKHRNRY